MKKANDIMMEVFSAQSVYDQIVDTIIQPNYHLKGELLSELSLSFLTNRRKIENAYKEGWFKYMFIRAVKSQVHSNTSSFHKNARQTINSKFGTQDFDFDYLEEEDDSDIVYKQTKEKNMNNITEAKKKIKITWFESEMARLYYDENMTYRAIEDLYGVDHCLVFHTVKKYKEKLSSELDKKQYNN